MTGFDTIILPGQEALLVDGRTPRPDPIGGSRLRCRGPQLLYQRVQPISSIHDPTLTDRTVEGNLALYAPGSNATVTVPSSDQLRSDP